MVGNGESGLIIYKNSSLTILMYNSIVVHSGRGQGWLIYRYQSTVAALW